MSIPTSRLQPESKNIQSYGQALILMICLRLGTFLCFAGWSWVHLYWEPAYASLFWSDATYQWAQRLGINWDEFVGTGASDGWLQAWIARIGWLHLLCAILSISARRNSWVQFSILFLLGSLALFLTAWGAYVNSGCELPALIEHLGQVLMPVLLVFGLAFGPQSRLTISVAVVAVILTFAGHGCYALGLWPTPPNFFGMTMLITGAEYETAVAMLRFAGVADLLVCLTIMVPYLRVIAAGYAATWGFLTAIARPVAGMSFDLNYWGADQFLHEAVVRAPHFLIPLYLLVWFWRDWLSNDNASNSTDNPSETNLVVASNDAVE